MTKVTENKNTLSRVAKTEIKTFEGVMNAILIVVKLGETYTDKVQSILISLFALMARKDITVDQFIEGLNAIVNATVIQKARLIIYIEKFSFLIYDKENKTFELRKKGNETISKETLDKVKSIKYNTLKVQKDIVDITILTLIDDTEKDIDKLRKLIANDKNTHVNKDAVKIVIRSKVNLIKSLKTANLKAVA